jgi:hypothetical protein
MVQEGAAAAAAGGASATAAKKKKNKNKNKKKTGGQQQPPTSGQPQLAKQSSGDRSRCLHRVFPPFIPPLKAGSITYTYKPSLLSFPHF